MKKYIELAKKKHSKSQNGIGEMMKMSKAGISSLANGGTASEETLEKLAKFSGANFYEILADYELSRDHSPAVKNIWKKVKENADQYILC